MLNFHGISSYLLNHDSEKRSLRGVRLKLSKYNNEKLLDDDELTVQLPIESKETSIKIQTRKTSKNIDDRNHSLRCIFVFF